MKKGSKEEFEKLIRKTVLYSSIAAILLLATFFFFFSSSFIAEAITGLGAILFAMLAARGIIEIDRWSCLYD